MAATLLFVHGWGYRADFWTPLRAALSDLPALAWDLGFFGRPEMPEPTGEVVAVGHSFGLLWLLEKAPAAWRGMIAVNGFTRFARAPDFAEGVAPRLLARMQARLAEEPRAVLDDFLARCGDERPAAGTIDQARLNDALYGLAGWDRRDQAGRIGLVLAGEADPIVPPAMTRAAFGRAPIVWHPGGHLLPRTAPDWCARRIRAFLADGEGGL